MLRRISANLSSVIASGCRMQTGWWPSTKSLIQDFHRFELFPILYSICKYIRRLSSLFFEPYKVIYGHTANSFFFYVSVCVWNSGTIVASGSTTDMFSQFLHHRANTSGKLIVSGCERAYLCVSLGASQLQCRKMCVGIFLHFWVRACVLSHPVVRWDLNRKTSLTFFRRPVSGDCIFSPIAWMPFAPMSTGRDILSPQHGQWVKGQKEKQSFMAFDIICWDCSVAVLFWVYYVSCPVPIMQFDLNVGVLFLFETLSDGIIVLFLCSEVRVWERSV